MHLTLLILSYFFISKKYFFDPVDKKKYKNIFFLAEPWLKCAVCSWQRRNRTSCAWIIYRHSASAGRHWPSGPITKTCCSSRPLFSSRSPLERHRLRQCDLYCIEIAVCCGYIMWRKITKINSFSYIFYLQYFESIRYIIRLFLYLYQTFVS